MSHMLLIVRLTCAVLFTASFSAAAPPAQQGAGTAVAVIVTDQSGNRLPEVEVTTLGPDLQTAVTSDEGQTRFTGLSPGPYRFRFERDGFIPFEREVVVQAGRKQEVRAALSAMPMLRAQPESEPEEPAPPAEPAKPTSVVMEAFLHKNRIDDADPNRRTQIGCTDRSTVTLYQVNDLLEDQVQEEADTILTVVEGRGVLRLGEAHHPMVESMVVSIPRGISYSIRREGRDPLVVLLTLAGAPCAP